MNRFYGMGEWGNALCGMDDAGEMSSWYVFAAMGFYPYSPADAEYIVSVPVFDKIELDLSGQKSIIQKENSGKKIQDITFNGEKIEGYFISDKQLKAGGNITIKTE